MSVLLDGFLKRLKNIRISAPGDNVAPNPDLPGPVTDLSADDITINSFALYYTPSANASDHEYSLDGGSWQPLYDIIDGLRSLTAYSVRVRGVNEHGAGPASAPLNVTTLASLPGPIATVTVSEITTTGAKITRTNAARAAYYQYSIDGQWRALPGNGIISDLVQNTGYTVLVRGVNADGPGPATASDPFATLKAVPGAISGLTVIEVTETTAKLVFNDALYATSYSYSLDGTTWKSLASDRVVVDLVKGTVYSVQVRGENFGVPGPSSAVGFTTLLPLPGPVFSLNVVDVTDTSARMDFTDATDATFYQYSPDDGASWLALGADRTVRTLSASTSYAFRVRGGNATGYGLPSTAVIISTVGAYATFDPARTGSGMTLSNNNLTVQNFTGSWRTTMATVGALPTRDKFRYAEFRLIGPNARLMLVRENYDVETIDESTVSYYPYGGDLRVNMGEPMRIGSIPLPTPDNPQYIGVLWNGFTVWIVQNGLLTYSPNNNGYDTQALFGTPGTSTTKVYPAVATLSNNGTTDNVTANFGGSPWHFMPQTPWNYYLTGWN